MKKIDIQNPDTKIIAICTLTDAVEAELVRNTLIDHGIACELDGEHQGGFTGTFEIGIVIRETDKEEAKQVIETHYPHLYGST